MTTATRTARPKPVRLMRGITSVSPFDGLTVVRLTVVEGSKQDAYTLIHWADSFEVRVAHQDDASRSYRVVCRVGDARPLVCECKGNLFSGKECRHMALTAKLTEMGRLVFPANEDAGHDRGTTE